jgi:hypothetical protein
MTVAAVPRSASSANANGVERRGERDLLLAVGEREREQFGKEDRRAQQHQRRVGGLDQVSAAADDGPGENA